MKIVIKEGTMKHALADVASMQGESFEEAKEIVEENFDKWVEYVNSLSNEYVVESDKDSENRWHNSYFVDFDASTQEQFSKVEKAHDWFQDNADFWNWYN